MPEDMTRLCERIARLEEASAGLNRRVEDQEKIVKTMYELANTTRSLVRSLDQTNENIRLMRRDVDELRYRPGKRWDVLITSGISAGVAALVAFIVGRIKGG